MAEYIDKRALLKSLHTGMDVIEMIQGIIDAPVVVVRCKDCVPRGDGKEVDDTCWCYEASHTVGEDDFCSHGKRKGGQP